MIYKPNEDRILIHDSYHCKRFKENHTVPFPVRRLEAHDRTAEMVTDVVGMSAPCPRRTRQEELKIKFRSKLSLILHVLEIFVAVGVVGLSNAKLIMLGSRATRLSIRVSP